MGGSLWASPLVGRDRELTLLEGHRRRSVSGRFVSLLLTAESGMGKTRLAAEFAARNRNRATVLSARAHPLGESASFALWSEALEHHLRHAGNAEIGDLCEGFLDDLSVIVRSVALTRGGAPACDPPKLRLIEGIAGVVGRLASRRPVIVLLDDVQDADASSWQTLSYLARTLPATPLLVLCVVRAGELADPGAEIAHDLEQEGLMEWVHLSPLDEQALSALARSVLGEEPPAVLPRWLRERSRGNPLFALSLLQGLLDEGADLADPSLRTVPHDLADRIVHRLGRVDDASRRTLELVSAMGGRIDLADLVHLSRRPVDALAAQLDTLVRTRWLVEEETGRRVTLEIPHPLIRDAVYQAAGAVRRRALHRQIARAHADAGRLGAAALHFARSADPGDPEAVAALRDAVRQAEAREAYAEALHILDALADLLPAGDPRWRDVVDALSWRAEWVVDHRADADAALGIRAMRRMLAALEGLDAPATRGAVKFRLASFLAWGTGELEEAEAVCAEARELFVAAGDDTSAMLAANELAWIRGLRGDVAGLEARARAVEEEADAADNRPVLLQALAAMAVGAAWQGGLTTAESLWELSIALADQEGKPYRSVVARMSLAVVKVFSGHADQAIAVVDEAKSLPVWRESPLPEWESMVRWAAGDFPAAVDCAREAVATGAIPSKRRALGITFAALSAIETDHADEAQRLLGIAASAYGDRDWACYRDHVRYVQAVLSWRRGLPQACLADLWLLSTRLARGRMFPTLFFVFVDLAQVAAEMMETEAAADASTMLLRTQQATGLELYRGIAALGEAWSGLAAEDPARARVAALDALACLSAYDLPYWSARAQQVLGRALADVKRDAALEAFRAAAKGFERCGAAWRRRTVIEDLRRLGPAGRRVAVATWGPLALTRREREVARLAARGHTARDIASRLAITERTVEGHLGNVYAKLGVSSKLELVRRESELRL